MPYAIEQQLITHNRSGKPLVPVGLIIHSTDNPGATAQNHHDYFNSGDRGASAHGFCDWLGKAIQTIPFNEQAWHALSYANSHFIGWELCEAKTESDFAKVWDIGVWVAATICIQFKFDPKKDMHSHKWVTENYAGDHTDPIPYFTKWGKTWEQFVADVKVRIVALLPPTQNVDLLRYMLADVQVYANPDANSPVRYTLKKDQLIHLSQLQGEWAFTTYGSLGGWVSRKYLAEQPTKPVETPAAPVAPPLAATVTVNVPKDELDAAVKGVDDAVQNLKNVILKGVSVK